MAEKIKLGTNGNFGVKKGGTLAYNDQNGVFKAIELASSRASGATYVAESGLIADAKVGVPRIDWTNGVGELLLEPQSTNLITYSEDLVTGWGIGGGLTITPNATLSPDGSVSASEITLTATDGKIRNTSFGSLTGDYTFSYFAKAGVSNVAYAYFTGGIYNTWIDLSTGTLLTSTGTGTTNIQDFGNGWYRVSMTATLSSTTEFTIEVADDAISSGTIGDSIYVWGVTGENLSYPTSYIRTSGSAVTRIADAVTGNSSLGQVINSSEGVLYAEMSWLEDEPSALQRISLSDGNISQRVLLYKSTSNNTISTIVTSGTNVLSVNYNYSVLGKSAGDTFKLAIKWKENDFAFWVDGNEVGTSPSGSAPVGLNEFAFEGAGNVDGYYGRIRDLRVYDTALTDAELLSLTSL